MNLKRTIDKDFFLIEFYSINLSIVKKNILTLVYFVIKKNQRKI